MDKVANPTAKRGRKKGRRSRSESDATRRRLPSPEPETCRNLLPPEPDTRRSLRQTRHRHRHYSDYYDGDDFEDDDEEEDERRREKKVLKVSPSDASDSENGNKNLLNKKRRIDGCDDAEVVEEEECENEKDGAQKPPSEPVPVIYGTSFSKDAMPLPDRKLMELILDKLQKKDTYGVYAEPVDPEELPDYHEIIENPMDFGTIRKKLAADGYSTLEQFESDVFLICTNAMQYNAQETIYFKQARSIQELARKKFEKLRDRELKSTQKLMSTSVTVMPMRKSSGTVQEYVGSDFSSGATLVTAKDACTLSNTTQPGGDVEKPGSVDSPSVDGNSLLHENKMEKMEELPAKGFPFKLGRKLSLQDENRRATYSISNQPVLSTESIFSTFESETKQLVSVGLHEGHSYARSLARFASVLGPVAWKVASKRIEKALPAGSKFGRGWVGEYEPLPISLLTLESHTQMLPSYNRQQYSKTELVMDETVEKSIATQNGSPEYVQQVLVTNLNSSAGAASKMVMSSTKEGSWRKANVEGKHGSFDVIAMRQQQKKSLTVDSAKPRTNVLKQVEASSSSWRCSTPSEAQRPECSSEVASSRLVEKGERNGNLVGSTSLNQPEVKPPTNHQVSQTVNNNMRLPTANGRSSSDSTRVGHSYLEPVSTVQACPQILFSATNNQHILDDPSKLMKILAGKVSQDPHQLKSSNSPTIVESHILPSIPVSGRDDSFRSAAAANGWMSIGRASHCNPTPGSPFSGGGKAHGILASQTIMQAANGGETQLQNSRHVAFPQHKTPDSLISRMQSPWQGFLPNSQQSQSKGTLPPDLNVGFQSLGSPVQPSSSGLRADSQQPNLVLQL